MGTAYCIFFCPFLFDVILRVFTRQFYSEHIQYVKLYFLRKISVKFSFLGKSYIGILGCKLKSLAWLITKLLIILKTCHLCRTFSSLSQFQLKGFQSLTWVFT